MVDDYGGVSFINSVEVIVVFDVVNVVSRADSCWIHSPFN